MTDAKDDLQDRVEKFRSLGLPGQPMGMHMGTAYLVNDLWREVERLRAAPQALAATPAVGGEALRKAIIRLREYAGVLDSDAYADINEPNLRGDIELVCSAAQPASPLRGRETKILAIIEEIEINRKIGADHRFFDDEWLTIEAALRASASPPEQPALRGREALEPLARISLWQDKYPDGPDCISDQSLQKYFTPDEVRAARAVLASPPEQPAAAPDTGRELREALQEAIDVFEGMNDDEINVELLPRLRAALSPTAPDKDTQS